VQGSKVPQGRAYSHGTICNVGNYHPLNDGKRLVGISTQSMLNTIVQYITDYRITPKTMSQTY